MKLMKKTNLYYLLLQICSDNGAKMKKNKKAKLRTNNKIFMITLFLAFLIIYYIFRLFQLQILDVYDYKIKGNAVSKFGKVISPQRGDILDRNNKPIAISREVENLYLLPVTDKEKSLQAERIRQNEEQFNKLDEKEKLRITKLSSLPVYNDEEIEKLSRIINIDKNNIYKLIEEEKEGYIYRAVSKSQKKQIEALDLKYIRFINSDDRFYPNNDILSSTIGFIDEGGIPNSGLEYYYDDILSGKSGYREFFKAVQGTEIPYTESKDIETKDANNIVTTIDLDLQKILTNSLKEAFYQYNSFKSSGIITNPNNGEVLAMESIPNFDANNPRALNSEIDKIYLENTNEDDISKYVVSRWRNNNVESTYDPGSTFKIISSSVALESHNYLKNKVYEDKGTYEIVPGVVIKSWRYWDPHGPQKLKEAFINSSNPVYVQLVQDIGKKDFINYSSVFNFGKKTNIDLPAEQLGFYPKDENVSDVEFGTLSYGHYANATPIQLISAYNSIVNGGKYYKPHLLKSIHNKNGELIYEYEEEYISKTVSEATSDEINDFMNESGQQYKVIQDSDLSIGIKTGTTVKYKNESIFAKQKEKEGLITSLFASYPAENPKYTLYLYFDEPIGVNYSSDISVNIANNIFKEISRIRNSEVKIDEDNKELIKVPELKDLTVEEANELLAGKGLKLIINGNYSRYQIIDSQYPESGNLINPKIGIEVKLREEMIVPNFVGLDKNSIMDLLNRNIINYTIEGDGNIIESQSIEAGQIININEEIVLKTKEN